MLGSRRIRGDSFGHCSVSGFILNLHLDQHGTDRYALSDLAMNGKHHP
jgi:hypothetical protein